MEVPRRDGRGSPAPPSREVHALSEHLVYKPLQLVNVRSKGSRARFPEESGQIRAAGKGERGPS